MKSSKSSSSNANCIPVSCDTFSKTCQGVPEIISPPIDLSSIYILSSAVRLTILVGLSASDTVNTPSGTSEYIGEPSLSPTTILNVSSILAL